MKANHFLASLFRVKEILATTKLICMSGLLSTTLYKRAGWLDLIAQTFSRKRIATVPVYFARKEASALMQYMYAYLK